VARDPILYIICTNKQNRRMNPLEPKKSSSSGTPVVYSSARPRLRKIENTTTIPGEPKILSFLYGKH
jgi:hypothetical protein